MKAILLSLVLCVVAASPTFAQELTFIIRHAEKEATGDDPHLSEAGRSRAETWADLLGSSGIDIVIHTDATRSRETAQLISTALDVDQAEVPMSDTAGLMDLLAFDHAEDTVLVIAHTETIPGILFQLGVEDPVEIEAEDFANLFVVASSGGDAPVFVRLRMP